MGYGRTIEQRAIADKIRSIVVKQKQQRINWLELDIKKNVLQQQLIKKYKQRSVK